MQRVFLYPLLLLCLLSGCARTPKGVLDRQQMENLLIEMHLAEAVMDEYPSEYRTPEMRQRLLAGVFKKQGVTKADFDSSLVYYGANLDQYMKIYQKVSDRLEKEQDLLSKELIAYQKALLTPEGDSVNIWKEKPQLVLNPVLLSTTDIFVIKSDTNFKANDRVVWRMRMHHLPVDSMAFAYVLLGRTFNYSQVEVVNAKPTADGWVKLELTLPEFAPNDQLFGSVSLLSKKNTFVDPIFVDSISLMRYHDHPTGSIPSDSLRADSLKVDSLRLDSLKRKKDFKQPDSLKVSQSRLIKQQAPR